MSLFTDHPSARWAAPVAAVAAVAVGTLATNLTASADPDLPPRTAAQLLVDVQRAQLADICGNPAGAPCKQEAAARVCFGKPSFTQAKTTTAQ